MRLRGVEVRVMRLIENIDFLVPGMLECASDFAGAVNLISTELDSMIQYTAGDLDTLRTGYYQRCDRA